MLLVTPAPATAALSSGPPGPIPLHGPISPTATAEIKAEYRRLIRQLKGLVAIGDIVVEDFSAIEATYHTLERAGVHFSPEFELIMMVLHIQCIDTDDDADSDNSDEQLEGDDPDEDGSDDLLDREDPDDDVDAADHENDQSDYEHSY